MDRGHWISWYDLDDSSKVEYLDWLRNICVPKRL
jgi:hypothetical protein